MATHSFKNNDVFIHFINEKPVRFDMTLSSAGVIPNQFVISVNGIQSVALKKSCRNYLEFIQIFASLSGILNVPGKLLCVNRLKH